ncbi:MAG TPA: hypothetical protein VGZ25_15270 [Gemmataceae bacterium]|nr:hypothetical protein [Gemmataceae bacterium]
MGWMQFLFSFSLLWEKLGASSDWILSFPSPIRLAQPLLLPSKRTEFPSNFLPIGSAECGNYEMVRLALLFLTIASLNGLFAFGLIAEMRFEFAYLLSLAFFFFGLLTLMSGLFRRSKLPRSNSSLLIYVQKQ